MTSPRPWRLLGPALVLLLCGGCATPQAPERADARMAFLQQHLSVAALDPAVRGAFERADSGTLQFDTMAIRYRVVPDDAREPRAPLTETQFFAAAGGPFVTSWRATAVDGQPAARAVALTYRGIIDINTVTLAVAGSRAEPLIAMQSVFKVDGPPPSESGTGAALEYSYVRASARTPARHYPERVECAYGPNFLASDLSPLLHGMAQDLQCRVYNANNGIAFVHEMAYLRAYGVAIRVSDTTVRGRTSYAIEDVEVSLSPRLALAGARRPNG